MSYPIVKEAIARQWYKTWTDDCLSQKPSQRVGVEDPVSGTAAVGEDHDWHALAKEAMATLADLLDQGDATFESEGAVALHQALPDHPALCDPEFWIWLAAGPGREIILARYPHQDASQSDSDPVDDEKPKNPLPSQQNFFGSSAKETLFFRLWIRAEMGLASEDEAWEFVRPGKVDFWRSHVFRQLYAHHRPFLHAFVDFQFPSSLDPDRNVALLNTSKIRILARELSMACANVVIESLDQAQCSALINRVYEERVPKD